MPRISLEGMTCTGCGQGKYRNEDQLRCSECRHKLGVYWDLDVKAERKILVATLPRSGSHAFARWLLFQDVRLSHFHPLKPHTFPNVDFTTVDGVRLAKANNLIGAQSVMDKADLVSLRMERYPLDILERVRDAVKPTHCLMLLRSFENWIVSRNKGADFNILPHELGLYEDYAYNSSGLGFRIVCYDKWHAGESYRQGLCDRLGLFFTDFSKDVPVKMFGGSRFGDMNTLERGEEMPEVVKKYATPELLAASEFVMKN